MPEAFHYTTWTAERSIAAIEQSVHNEKPFFVWASFHDPHPPYLVPAPWDTMYAPNDMEPGTLFPGELSMMPPQYAKTQEEAPDFSAWRETPWANHGFHSHLIDDADLRKNMAIYYGMISFMDKQIGHILDRLDELGVAGDTLVVFTTDHGHFLGQHGLTAKGAFPYEDLLKLPFIVRWKEGGVQAGRECDALQSLVDLAPTFLAASGISIPGVMQGVSQLPVWREEVESVRDMAISEFRHQPTQLHLRTYITERYKMTVYRDQTYGELFDLFADPGETRNRWNEAAYAGVKADLMQQSLNAEIVREPTRYPRIAGA